MLRSDSNGHALSASKGMAGGLAFWNDVEVGQGCLKLGQPSDLRLLPKREADGRLT